MVIVGKKNGSISKIDTNAITTIVKGMRTHTIIGGEFAVVNDDTNIAFKTLLGSCVAIMFYDKVKHLKGMNHFLLPHTTNMKDDMKYGLYSVELLLNEMYKLGCLKKNIICKISGGADIMNLDSTITNSIGHRNVEFAHEFCKTEGFKIISDHTRGKVGRIILLTNNFETFIKTVDNKQTSNDVVVYEKSLQVELSNNNIYTSKTSSTSAIELF